MNSPKNLEISGYFREHTLPELLSEIADRRFNGSLRAAREAFKAVVYFDAGDVIFAVSNSRMFRLYEILLREGLVDKDQLLLIPEFTNDLILSKSLIDRQIFTARQITDLFTQQISEIVASIFGWDDGEWIFSPLVRVKGDINYKINARKLLIEYSRNLPDAAAAARLKAARALFGARQKTPNDVNLLPHEAFVLSRFEDSLMNCEEIIKQCGLPENAALQSVYALWLGGFLVCKKPNAAFSDAKVSEILAANLTLVRDENQAAAPVQPVRIPAPEVAVPPKAETAAVEEAETSLAEKTLTVDEQLERIEKARNHYEVIGVGQKADLAEIKQSYFALAKILHPDLFHKETNAAFHRRIQDTFAKLASVYDTLKTQTSREVYDFKMRKEITENSHSDAEPTTTERKSLETQASENFEQGFSLLMDETPDAALPFFARAVFFAPNVARFHAYYGKALSFDSNQLHKAEGELQMAVKLESESAVYRIMLAEFFVQVGLQKRAEGELNRLLSKFPDNREARALLDSLRNK